ncbi:hypothetical protein AAGQ96_10020 [Pantoea sp. MBD-2R]|uniref:hypothetical protein n=1 Tax=Pantoea sp. MBD-2R TaxID=3141540 RepID=UPI003183BBD8
MKTVTKIGSGLFAIVGLFAVIAWPYAKMEFASSAAYTQMDKNEYEYYTPDLLKNMPRISDSYTFHYTNISGPHAFVYEIRFKGTTQTKNVRDYLLSTGFKPQTECDVEAECWLSAHSKGEVTVSTFPSPPVVIIQMSRNNYDLSKD